jgi:hypothetical protein
LGAKKQYYSVIFSITAVTFNLGQDVDIPLVVGGALVVGEATFSPLTGGVNANDTSLGPSIGMSSYDDATIRDNTMSRETNDELI